MSTAARIIARLTTNTNHKNLGPLSSSSSNLLSVSVSTATRWIEKDCISKIYYLFQWNSLRCKKDKVVAFNLKVPSNKHSVRTNWKFTNDRQFILPEPLTVFSKPNSHRPGQQHLWCSSNIWKQSCEGISCWKEILKHRMKTDQGICKL